MTETVKAARIDEIPPGTGKELTLSGRIVALYNVGGEFHALDGICPHAGGPLGKGMLQGTVVTCPWHGWQFDVTTGQHCLNANLCQTRYTVSVVGEEIFVELP